MEEKDTLKKFGNEFQSKAISTIISDQKYLEQIYDILDKSYWDTDACQWIVEETMGYFISHKSLPTPLTFKVQLSKLDNEVLKTSIVEQLRYSHLHSKDTDLPYVKEQFLEFCVNQKM